MVRLQESNKRLWFWPSVDWSLGGEQVENPSSRRLLLVCLLWASVIFAIDLSVSPGIAVAVPYFCLILMGLWLPHRHYFPIATLGSMGLTLVGFLNSPLGGDSILVLSNRVIALMAIAVTGILCHLYKREERELKASHEDLRKRVTELRGLKEKYEESSKTDHLTNLPNRRCMREKLEYEKFLFKRNKRPFVIFIADIDYFKKINDTYGHEAGDKVLVRVAQILKSNLRKTDGVCRWGGEEFLAMLPESGLQGGILLAEKLRSKIESEVFIYSTFKIAVTMSFGVSVYDHGTLDLNRCIKRADENLYKAKETGRNKVVSSPAFNESYAFIR